jgi:hypothetical protein
LGLALSVCAQLQLADSQIVGGYNVGFNPRAAAVGLRNSRVANTGISKQHAWFGGGGATYNPFGSYSQPVKPFSSPQFYHQNRPLMSSMDAARLEVTRSMNYGWY